MIFSDFEDDGEDESDGGWQQELQRRYAQEVNFMAELQARNLAHSPESNNQSICQNYVNQDTNQSFSASNVINNGGQNYGGPHAYPHHKYMGHLASQMQSPFNPQVIYETLSISCIKIGNRFYEGIYKSDYDAWSEDYTSV